MDAGAGGEQRRVDLDDADGAAGAEEAPDLGEQGGDVAEVLEDEHDQRAVERGGRDRQRRM